MEKSKTAYSLRAPRSAAARRALPVRAAAYRAARSYRAAARLAAAYAAAYGDVPYVTSTR